MHAHRTRRSRLLAGLFAACWLPACGSTTDTIGQDNAATMTSAEPPDMTPPDMTPPDTTPPEKPSLSPLSGPQAYSNPFNELLGKTNDEIDKVVNAAFEQLFHGADDEIIYFPDGDDAAAIRDILHGKEARTEGIGLGMLISVELGKQEEFDKLWTYAQKDFVDFKTGGLRFASGANEGYFNSHCDTPMGTTVACVDPYGMEHFAMALIFAHDVWGSAGGIDYEAEALAILDVMRNKEKMNGGIVDKVTNMFDAETHLAFDLPETQKAQQTRPSVLMPAYYALWAEATGDATWLGPATAARDFFPLVANTKTGLMPQRAYFDGKPVQGFDTFNAESYRALINLVLDDIWTTGNPSAVRLCNTVLGFFSDQGIAKYGGTYELDGTAISTNREYALVVVNGIVASVSDNDDRKAYIQAVWDLDLPKGSNRYYTGILQLFALLVLSGKMQVL